MTSKDIKGKMNPSLIPLRAMESITRVREFGNQKYTPESFYQVDPKLLVDAAFRHLVAVLKTGNLNEPDPESGLLHLEHALCSLGGAVEILRRSIENDAPQNNGKIHIGNTLLVDTANPDIVWTPGDLCAAIREGRATLTKNN